MQNLPDAASYNNPTGRRRVCEWWAPHWTSQLPRRIFVQLIVSGWRSAATHRSDDQRAHYSNRPLKKYREIRRAQHSLVKDDLASRQLERVTVLPEQVASLCADEVLLRGVEA